ncbi:MAG: ABC transporter substrate-binding protein, partial [Anaerolineales bacterium]|nr:ABC transporter substrate-binding protein [Anaerolineales bacterium]
SEDGNGRAVNENVYETLLTRDAAGELQPLLATEYTQVDDTTWEFTLREGVSFHNGAPFNAEAVAFSVNRIVDPATASDQVNNFATITSAEAVSDNVVRILTNGPDPILPARLNMLMIVEPGHVQADPEVFATTPIGTGPYKFVSWDRGVDVTIEKNPDYWGEPGSIDVVHYRPILEESTRLAALQAGEVDLVFGLLPEQIDSAPVAVHRPGLEFPVILLHNGPDSVLADVRLRQAMNYAVDKEGIAEAIYGGYAVPADGQVLTPGHFGYNPDVKAYPYDPAKAQELIAESGYDGAEIVLESEVGRWLKDKELVEVVAGQLAEVGLNVRINISEFSNYLDILFDPDNRAPMIFVSHDNTLLDADRTLSGYYSCEGTAPSYCNEAVTAMINAARTETDVAAREAMYHEIVKTAHDEASHLFLVNIENIYGLSERLNWEPRLDGRLLITEMSLK